MIPCYAMIFSEAEDDNENEKQLFVVEMLQKKWFE